jgi:hypothetical protein
MENPSYGESAAEKSIPPDQIYRPDIDTSEVDERKLMRSVDIHVIPWLSLIYLLNFLDRGSIGNAKVRTFSIVLSLRFDFE